MDQLIKTYTKHLRLPYIHQNLSFHLEQARLENQSYEEFLLNLFQYEVELRQQNGVNTRIRAAKFPYLKHLEELEVAALPLEAQKHYQTLKSLEFIEKKQVTLELVKVIRSLDLELKPVKLDIMCILRMFRL